MIQIDFTIEAYWNLILALQKQSFSFNSLINYFDKPSDKVIIIRHDVDRVPLNSLEFAKIEAAIGIKGTFYFRIVPQSFDEKIIKEICSLGHEIGYHYEDFVFARQKTKVKRQMDEGNNNITTQRHNAITKKEVGIKKYEEEEYERYLASLAIVSFKENLERMRQIVPVKTICMHGSPMSKWDSRLLWKYYDYHDFGIAGEPYFDINFDEVLYLTDTGRRWDGDFFNVRDKAQGSEHRAQGKRNPATSNKQPATFLKFHSTFDIIRAAEEGKLPDKIIMTFHPQRWTDKPMPWLKELVWQNTKNVGKFFLKKVRSRK